MAKKRRNRPRAVTPETTKSLPQFANTGGATHDLTAVSRAISEQAQVGTATPMPRDWFPYAFGPGVALQPAPLDPTRPDTGRAEPRIWQYPVTWNIHVPGQEHRPVPWKVLKDAATKISLIWDCIRIRKAEIQGLDWDIVIGQRAVETAQRNDPSAKRADIEQDMRRRLGPEIDRVAQFWQMPDKVNGHTFSDWINQVLLEHLILDAVAIYPRYTYGGDLHSFEVLDGSTIKPLLDNRGGRPMPPEPAYQQVLHGFPRGEYTADVTITDDGDALVDGGYPADQLVYIRREVRPDSPYGFSAVEAALTDADLWMKRMAWLRAEYTDGVMPAGWLENENASWTPQQLKDFEREFNDFYAGQTEQRQRFRILPPNVRPAENVDVSEKWKPEYDLHLIKLIASHFDVTIAELGFTESKGLGSSGFHEGQENVQERKGTLPTLKWLGDKLTELSRKHLKMPAELEFRWLGLDDEDEAAADAVADARFRSGAKTLNERRDELGLPRFNFIEADMPMIVGQRGVVFLEGASTLVAPGEEVTPPQAPPMPGPPEGADSGPDTGDAATGDTGKAPPKPPAADETAAKATEVRAYRRFVAKGIRGREFRWLHHTASEVAQITKASDAGPKDSTGRTWPGWARDLQIARYWAAELRQALTGAIDPKALAERWLQARKSADPADAAAWLFGDNVSAVEVVREVLTQLYTEGYLVGQRSAESMLSGLAVNWSDWTPGNPDAAAALIGQDVNLAQLLDSAGITIQSIASHRLDELAQVLADALEAGDGVGALTKSLAGVLDDPQWAELVAITETSRAVSFATQSTYLANGIQENDWMTALDQRVCVACDSNEAWGDVPVGQDFPSGQTAPPAHPACRCALAPVIP